MSIKGCLSLTSWIHTLILTLFDVAYCSLAHDLPLVVGTLPVIMVLTASENLMTVDQFNIARKFRIQLKWRESEVVHS